MEAAAVAVAVASVTTINHLRDSRVRSNRIICNTQYCIHDRALRNMCSIDRGRVKVEFVVGTQAAETTYCTYVGRVYRAVHVVYSHCKLCVRTSDYVCARITWSIPCYSGECT